MSAVAGSVQSAADVKFTPQSKGLHIVLWVAQVALAFMFVMAGFPKLTQPLADLAQKMSFVAAIPGPLVRFIGICELAGAVGLILPALTRVMPVLTAWAAVGLATVMLLASLFHISRGELSNLPFTLVLGSVAAFVAWGRFGRARIPSRRPSRG